MALPAGIKSFLSTRIGPLCFRIQSPIPLINFIPSSHFCFNPFTSPSMMALPISSKFIFFRLLNVVFTLSIRLLTLCFKPSQIPLSPLIIPFHKSIVPCLRFSQPCLTPFTIALAESTTHCLNEAHVSLTH